MSGAATFRLLVLVACVSTATGRFSDSTQERNAGWARNILQATLDMAAAPEQAPDGELDSSGTDATLASGTIRLPADLSLSTDEPSLELAPPHPLPPTEGSIDADQSPLPTNAWWLDLVIEAEVKTFIAQVPYHFKALPAEVEVAYAPIFNPGTVGAIFQVPDPALSIVAPELDAAAPEVVAFDDLSVTLEWAGGEEDGGEGPRMRSPMVQGTPYITVELNGVTPAVAIRRGVVSVDSRSLDQGVVKTVLEFNDGTRWLVYTPEGVELEYDEATAMLASPAGPITGAMRVAISTNAEMEELLDDYSATYPRGGSVSVTMDGTEASEARVVFDFEAATMASSAVENGETSSELLMLALPHQRAALGMQSECLLEDTHVNIKGRMCPVAGSSWNLTLPLPQVSWFSSAGFASEEQQEEVRAALQEDASVYAAVAQSDPYFGPKTLAQWARLVLIAEELGEEGIAADLRDRIRPVLDTWLDGDVVRYDSTYGGIVHISSLGDLNSFYGHVRFNDHHFHWGYLLYAIAVVGRGDADWLERNWEVVEYYVRDIAAAGNDPYFTKARHVDWYAGHSWAAGVVKFADGRNQESTSEAVNAYYALALMGLVRRDAALQAWGRMLMAQEIVGAQAYWQVKACDDEGGFVPRDVCELRSWGIVWATKMDYATFFGLRHEFVHGIQYLPFTPASEALLDEAWIRQSFPILQPTLESSDLPEWRGYILGAEDGPPFWDNLQGSTRTNILWWIATRPAAGSGENSR